MRSGTESCSWSCSSAPSLPPPSTSASPPPVVTPTFPLPATFPPSASVWSRGLACSSFFSASRSSSSSSFGSSLASGRVLPGEATAGASAWSGEETTGSDEIIMSWVVFSARGTRFFPDGGGGSSRGKASKDMKLKERRNMELHIRTTWIQHSVSSRCGPEN